MFFERTSIKSLLNRVKNILIRPQHEWQLIKDEQNGYIDIIVRYVAILAAVPPAAAVLDRVIFDRNIPNSALGSSITYLVLTNILWYCMYVLNVVIAGAIVTVVVLTSESGSNSVSGLKIAAYSFTPLFIAGSIAVIPGMGWIVEAGILYSFYLLYLGITNLGSIGKRQAVWYAAGSFLCAAVVVGVMNLFEYFFESLVVSKIVF